MLVIVLRVVRRERTLGLLVSHSEDSMKNCPVLTLGASLSLAAAAFAYPVHAQPFPAKPIHVLIGSAPGGVLDIVTRQLAERLEAQTGQRVIVEAKASAGGIVALEALKNSAPDGYTIATVPMSQMSVSPSLFRSLPYDPLKDFAPVGILFRGPQLLVVNASVPAVTLKELTSLSLGRPEGIRYSSPANGSPSHVIMEEVRFQTGANLQHIPYRGPNANIAVVSGEVDALLEGVAPMLPLIQADKVRALAVTGNRRVAVLPDVPTFAELGIKDIDAVWVGVIAPRGTPQPVIEFLNAQFARAVRSPELLRAYEKLGRVVAPGSPREMAATIESEIPRWREVVRRAGIVAN